MADTDGAPATEAQQQPDNIDDVTADGKLHIVDEHKQMSVHVADFLRRTGVHERGFDYNLVAVFGVQSSGKSTLLNHLFGTTFDVMKPQQRQQTTKGLWLSVGTPQNVLVLDVEGTDGRERGEDKDMERKSALFSLAIAEVLIINMRESDVGLYNGANYALLKTVLDVNLRLFQAKGSPKTHLLFVVRDHEEVPMESHEEILRRDLDKMFDDIKKPDHLVDAHLADFFDLSFIGLPHKKFKPAEFDKAVQALQQWFVNKGSKKYLFSHAYSRRIPIDGFPKYASSVWDEIKNNRELDIPNQRQLLSKFRCSEIMKAALESFEGACQRMGQTVADAEVPELNVWMAQARATAIDEYQKRANRYDNAVFEEVKSELLHTVHAALQVLFVRQLSNVVRSRTDAFKTTFKAAAAKKPAHFAETAERLRAEAFADFDKRAAASKLEEVDWSADDMRKQLVRAIEEVVELSRMELQKDLVDVAKNDLAARLTESLNKHMYESAPNMWTLMHADVLRLGERFDTTYAAQLSGLCATKVDAEDARGYVFAHLRSVFLERTRKEASTTELVGKLRKRFESLFRYDVHKRPREWRPEDDFNGIFDKAMDEASKLLNLYTEIRSDPFVEFRLALGDDDKVLIPSDERIRVFDMFKPEADNQLLEVKKISVASKVPVWGWVLLFVFAWNDFLHFLSDPIWTTLYLLMFGALVFTVYVVIVGNEYDRKARQWLEEHQVIEKVTSATQQLFGLAVSAWMRAAMNGFRGPQPVPVASSSSRTLSAARRTTSDGAGDKKNE